MASVQATPTAAQLRVGNTAIVKIVNLTDDEKAKINKLLGKKIFDEGKQKNTPVTWGSAFKKEFDTLTKRGGIEEAGEMVTDSICLKNTSEMGIPGFLLDYYGALFGTLTGCLIEASSALCSTVLATVDVLCGRKPSEPPKSNKILMV